MNNTSSLWSDGINTLSTISNEPFAYPSSLLFIVGILGIMSVIFLSLFLIVRLSKQGSKE